MSFLKNIFGKKETTPSHKPTPSISSYEDFWNWFLTQEKKFHNTVKNNKNIHRNFFDKLSPKLNELREGIFFLTGMLNDETVDLILTVDGSIKNFYFTEELVKAAPAIKGWEFKAHKPSVDIQHLNIEMGDYNFGKQNMYFYANNLEAYPDEIDITIVHNSYNEQNKAEIINGCYILLDNYIGELHLLTTVDNVRFIEKSLATEELVPIEKLKDFLIWREKEFIEKYEDLRYHTEEDSYSGLEATLENGNALIAIINTDLLKWDGKASHPWILSIEILYNGKKNRGMPDDTTYELLNKIEEDIHNELKDFEGYLNIGRQTADNKREVYFACKEFRKPCKVMDKIIKAHSEKIAIDYDIYKDKYWQSFERFQP